MAGVSPGLEGRETEAILPEPEAVDTLSPALPVSRRPDSRKRKEQDMRVAAGILVGLIALAHLWFLVLEMFLWKTPLGRKTFGTTPEVAETSAVLAANQGLYNGFLAAGLVWGLIQGLSDGRATLIFFLACVLIAGVYGGLTANRWILFIQALPAAVALALLRLAG